MFKGVIVKFTFFNILSIFTCILTIIIGLRKNWSEVVVASLVTLLGILIAMGVACFIDWWKSRLKVELYRNWEDAPPKYRATDTLKYLTENTNLQLEIIGRTCFRWLCGDEKDFVNVENTEFQEHQRIRQNLIREAIERGNSIHFILQDPNISIPYFTIEDKGLICKHARAAILSYKSIIALLSPPARQRLGLELSLTKKLVENSMVRLKSPKITRIIFDLNSNFKSSRTPADKVSTPFLVFESSTSKVAKVAELFDKEFNYLKSGHISLEEFEKQTEEGLKKVDRLIAQHHCYSSLRQDTSKNLAIVSARHFLAERQFYLVEKTPPPVSIHLLVTNKCPTVCKMCDHYKLFSNNELNLSEWEDILDEINKLGTKSVVISGGEPLMRDDLFELLTYGKTIGLSIGLLTNGVKENGLSLDTREADTLSKTCSWIQVSIDSFNEKTYEKIRGKPYLACALESLKAISERIPKKVEICFTIQQDNITEVPSLCQTIPSYIPREVPIRYKFAHGPTNDHDFLCRKDQISNLIKRLRTVVRSDCEKNNCHRCNAHYLISMIEKSYFDIEDLSQGTPLKNTMIRYNTLQYTCQALRLTCTIDANGDMYPCCFLFDDNRAKSTTRDLSKLTFKTPQQFSSIWYDNARLKEFRNMRLPIKLSEKSDTACNYCTRHFYQNELLNELNKIFTTYDGVAEKFIENNNEVPAFFI